MKNSQKGFVIPIIIAIVAVLIVGSGVYIYTNNKVEAPNPLIVCTMDAMQCLDGSYVGRSGPSCEFVCPESKGIIVTSTKSNDLVKLPITIEGYLDGNGWAANEGEVGTVEVFDSTGKSISSREVIRTTTDWLKFPTYFSAMVGDRQMMGYINTDTGYVKITSNSAKDGEQLKSLTIPIGFDNATAPTPELIDLPVYIQDKSYVATSSCSVTKKVVYRVPKTTAVADASLKILFNEELSAYGKYKSVSIVNGVAKVIVENGFNEGLSSCQSSHLFSVLKDTLTQYSSIKSVELVRADGSVIQF
jgi:hypothetical protein